MENYQPFFQIRYLWALDGVESTLMNEKIPDRFSLAERIAVVTGAGSGIGQAAATLFAEAGAHVIVADIDESSLTQTTALIGDRAIPFKADVANRNDVNDLAEIALSLDDRIDVWVNNAGIAKSFNILDASEDALEETLAINLKGAYWGCAAAARAMVKRRSGSIINVSSAGADSCPPGMSAYAISKAGINALTRSVARELGPMGIRANSIAPGSVETPMVEFRYTNEDGSIDEELRESTLKARRQASVLDLVGAPDDIANAMLYLATDASRFLTGQVIRVNGGTFML